MLVIRGTLVGALESVANLRRRLDDEMRHALQIAANMVATEARANHRFTNRTGRLERSIHATTVAGTFGNNTLHVAVSATMPYARYVEEVTGGGAWAFLRPAFARLRAELQRGMQDSLNRAVARARWRSR